MLRVSELRRRIVPLQILQQFLRLLSQMLDVGTRWQLARHLSS
jgi:hypothetical protein